jgi:phage shock protein C
MTKRLYKSRTDRMIAGVCGGLAEYFDVDPVLVRLLFLLLGFLTGIGFLIYPILWIVMPEQSSLERPPREVVRENLSRMHEDVERFGEEMHGGTKGSTIGAEGTTAEGPTVEETITKETGSEAEAGEAAPEWAIRDSSYYSSEPQGHRHSRSDRQFVGGIILLFLGLILLMQNLGVFWWASIWRLWPLALVAIGVYLLYQRSRHRL